MTPVSSVPTVKAWLFTTLGTACTAATGIDLLVRYAQPGPFDPEDVVSVGACRNRTVSPFALVGGFDQPDSMIEDYDIDIEVDVARFGKDVAQQATERAYTLIGQIETAVRADPTAGGAALKVVPASSSDDPEWTDNGALNVHAVVTVHVEAVI